jgi:hypothetical protein
MPNRNRTYINKAGVKGVACNGAGNFVATISYKGNTFYLGAFKDKDEAGRAYISAREKLYGDEAGREEFLTMANRRRRQ